MTFNQLFDLSFSELSTLVIDSNIVFFLRLWPVWVVIAVLVFLFIIYVYKKK